MGSAPSRSWDGNRVGSRLWMGDAARLLRTNVSAYGGPVWLVTVTAPGADVLPWDGVRVELQAAHDWNATAGDRWSELHRRARQVVRRSGHDVVIIGGAWQMHRRGVLHLHLILGFALGPDRAAAWSYVNALRARTAAHGFGFVDARDRDGKAGRSGVFEHPERAAGYLTRYLTQSSQFLGALGLPARPRRLLWVTRRMTQQTGCTMGRLRRARYLYVIRSGRSVIARAGGLPEWFRDARELAAVSALLAAPGGARAP